MTQTKLNGRKSTTRRLLLSGLCLFALTGSSQAQADQDILDLNFSYPAIQGNANTHKYYLTNLTGSWEQMEARAQLIGGHLVAINSLAEDALVHVLIANTEVAWIGLKQDPAGGTNEPGANWKWSNGDALTYTNWCQSPIQEPDNWNGFQDYGAIHSDISRTNGVSGTCWDDAHNSEVFGVTPTVYNNIQGIIEIVPCGNITANITGALPIFLGYGNQTDQLGLNLLGASGNLTFSWTGPDIATLSCTACTNPVFTPDGPKNYKFIVFIASEAAGCVAKATATISVTDIVDPSDRGKVVICHKGNTQSVAVASVATPHLSLHGDYLGPCTSLTRVVKTQEVAEVKVYPNPAQNEFVVEIPHFEDAASIVLTDIQGKILETRQLSATDNRPVHFDLTNSPRGLYMIDVAYDGQNFHSKIVRQ